MWAGACKAPPKHVFCREFHLKTCSMRVFSLHAFKHNKSPCRSLVILTLDARHAKKRPTVGIRCIWPKTPTENRFTQGSHKTWGNMQNTNQQATSSGKSAKNQTNSPKKKKLSQLMCYVDHLVPPPFHRSWSLLFLQRNWKKKLTLTIHVLCMIARWLRLTNSRTISWSSVEGPEGRTCFAQQTQQRFMGQWYTGAASPTAASPPVWCNWSLPSQPTKQLARQRTFFRRLGY